VTHIFDWPMKPAGQKNQRPGYSQLEAALLGM
jgi:hypothetical protein